MDGSAEDEIEKLAKHTQQQKKQPRKKKGKTVNPFTFKPDEDDTFDIESSENEQQLQQKQPQKQQQQQANSRKRAAVDPQKNRETLECPACSLYFTRKFALVRHMTVQHNMTPEGISEHNIGTTSQSILSEITRKYK